jgi:hypothetical protein
LWCEFQSITEVLRLKGKRFSRRKIHDFSGSVRGLLQGILGILRLQTWCFCGESVVRCMVDAGEKNVFNLALKNAPRN